MMWTIVQILHVNFKPIWHLNSAAPMSNHFEKMDIILDIQSLRPHCTLQHLSELGRQCQGCFARNRNCTNAIAIVLQNNLLDEGREKNINSILICLKSNILKRVLHVYNHQRCRVN